MGTLYIKKGTANGIIPAEPSKSYTHRALIMASLSAGKSLIQNISISEDTLATVECLRKLGASIEIYGNDAEVFGIKKESVKPCTLDCKESGSTLRFLIPIAFLFDKEIRFIGSKKLLSRPIDVYRTLSEKCNFFFSQSEDEIVVKGKLKAGKYILNADISSQFTSGLLMALSSLSAKSILDIDGEIKSKSYIDMTLETMKSFSSNVSFIDGYRYCFEDNHLPKATVYTIEGDMSQASYFSALNLFGSKIEIDGLNYSSIQGDKVYGEYFGQTLFSKPTIDVSNCPDLALILMAVGGAKNGIILKGTNRLKYKESDRINCMAKELTKFSVLSEIREDEVEVYASNLVSPSETIDTHNDHRICMALSVLLTLVGGKIKNYQCVNKSFPTFFEKLKKLGIEITEE